MLMSKAIWEASEEDEVYKDLLNLVYQVFSIRLNSVRFELVEKEPKQLIYYSAIDSQPSKTYSAI